MAKACSVCSLTDVASFDADIDADVSVRALAAKYGVSLGAVNRHKEHRKKAAVTATAPLPASRARVRDAARVPPPNRSGSPASTTGGSADPDQGGDFGALPADYPDGWRKRVAERAAQVLDRGRVSRIRFIMALGRDFVRGKTTEVLAQAWGLPEATIRGDADAVGIMLKVGDEAEIARAMFWQDAYEELEQMQPLRRRAAEVLREGLDGKLYQRIPDGEGGDMLAVVDPRGLKELSEALSELAQATDRCRDKIGKGSGVLTNSTTINVSAVLAAPVPVDVLGDELKVAELSASYGRIVELILGATTLDALKLAVRNELRGLRGKEPVVVEAPALPAGGEAK